MMHGDELRILLYVKGQVSQPPAAFKTRVAEELILQQMLNSCAEYVSSRCS